MAWPRNFLEPNMPNLASSWKPKRLQNRGRYMKNRCWKTTRFLHRFLKGSDFVLGRFLVGFLDQKYGPIAKRWLVWKINKSMAGRMKFEVRLLQQATKNQQKSMKNRMFLGTSILHGFWVGFGSVLGSQNLWFSRFFREKMEAKNKMIFGRLKNRILRPQEQIADEVRRSVRTRGKEYKDGGRPICQESEA